MRRIAARVGLGVTLILIVSAGLLFSDWARRTSARQLPRVALLQFSTYHLIEETVAGALDGLRARGFEDKHGISLQRFNANGDLPTLNTIAKAIIDAKFDMVITASTPALQAMAGANRDSKITHVFGAVTDPFFSGVGLDRNKPGDHPRHLIGVGTFQPVRETLQLTKTLKPDVRIVGTVWNPGETCSQACVRLAKTTARELGIELIESQVENTNGVVEAANAVIARGAQAIVIGGDNTVEAATPSVIKAANQAHIPVITYESGWALRGALFGLGANYYEVGRIVGDLAADVLQGRDPATVPIKDVVPKKLGLNLSVLPNLRETWRVPDDVRASAMIGVDEKGLAWDRLARTSANQPARSN